MATALSEKTANIAYNQDFQKRITYFFLQQAAGDTAHIQQWTYAQGPNTWSAYMIVCADPSVRDAINPIEPWDVATGNAAVSDGMLAAAVNAQWGKIKTAANINPPPQP